MNYESKNWELNAEQIRLEKTEICVTRWICRVLLRERKTADEMWRMQGMQPVLDVDVTRIYGDAG